MVHATKEAQWVALGFVMPLVLLNVIEVILISSPVAAWRRLLWLEDSCPYGYCFLVAAVIYGVVRYVIWVKAGFRRWRRRETDSRILSEDHRQPE